MEIIVPPVMGERDLFEGNRFKTAWLINVVICREEKALFTPFLKNVERGADDVRAEFEGAHKMIQISHAGRQDLDVTISFSIHLKDVRDQVHPILSPIIQTSHKRRDEDLSFLCALCRPIDGSRLLLRKTKGHIDTNLLLHRLLRRSQALF